MAVQRISALWKEAFVDMEEKQPAVYIHASRRNGTHYVGVTSNQIKRVWEHRNDIGEGFSQKYAIHLLVYYEQHASMAVAITREKQIKKWNRAWKLRLIEEHNPQWRDLWEEVIGAEIVADGNFPKDSESENC
jgi:putative endonuclease